MSVQKSLEIPVMNRRQRIRHDERIKQQAFEKNMSVEEYKSYVRKSAREFQREQKKRYKLQFPNF